MKELNDGQCGSTLYTLGLEHEGSQGVGMAALMDIARENSSTGAQDVQCNGCIQHISKNNIYEKVSNCLSALFKDIFLNFLQKNFTSLHLAKWRTL